MRALILAAGKGTRIARALSGQPKSMVHIGDRPLITHTVELLKKAGIGHIGVAVGYQHTMIMEEIQKYEVEFFYNPFFDVTNSIASAWFAKDFISTEDDLMIMNGDLFMEECMLKSILGEKASPVLFADSSRKDESDYKLCYENDLLLKYGKDLTGNDITGEYIGIAKIGREFIPTFKEHLEFMISQQKHEAWWEDVLYDLSGETDIYVKELTEGFWAEVDYIEDYERIKDYQKQLSHKSAE